jgi:hypothetical protein
VCEETAPDTLHSLVLVAMHISLSTMPLEDSITPMHEPTQTDLSWLPDMLGPTMTSQAQKFCSPMWSTSDEGMNGLPPEANAKTPLETSQATLLDWSPEKNGRRTLQMFSPAEMLVRKAVSRRLAMLIISRRA